MPEPTSAAPASSTPVPQRVGIIRRMYNWVLSWADTRWGTPALFVISFAESSFFPIPPDVLQLALSASRPKWSFFYAAVSVVASVMGAVLGWYIGYALWVSLGGYFIDYVPGVSQELVDKVGMKYHDNAFLAIFTAAFTPIPFKVFTISAGIFSEYVSLQTLMIASVLGRGARFFLVASLVYFFGPGIRTFIEKRLELMTILFTVLLVLGFVVIKAVL